jgi:hypothetical protein
MMVLIEPSSVRWNIFLVHDDADRARVLSGGTFSWSMMVLIEPSSVRWNIFLVHDDADRARVLSGGAFSCSMMVLIEPEFCAVEHFPGP